MGNIEFFIILCLIGAFVILVVAIFLRRVISLNVSKTGLNIQIRPSKEGR